MKWKIVAVIGVLGAIQLVPYGRNHTNPPVTGEPAWDAASTRETFTRVCSNCHSNTTVWPWYSSIAPVSWLVQRDVEEGREHFNVSEYDSSAPRKARDAAEQVREKEMPPWFYLLGHPEAKLSDDERITFAEGLSRTFGSE